MGSRRKGKKREKKEQERRRGEFPRGHDRSSITVEIGFVKSIAGMFVPSRRVRTRHGESHL